MAILKMKKIRLCGIAEEQDQLIRELQLLGSVEIGSPEALTEAQQTQLFRTADGGGADALISNGSTLAIWDETDTLFSMEAPCSARFVFYSSPELTEDGSYTLLSDGENAGTAEAQTSESQSGFGGMPGGRPGGFDPNGEVPSDMPNSETPPTPPDGGTPPEKPDGTSMPEPPDGSTPPEKPDGAPEPPDSGSV